MGLFRVRGRLSGPSGRAEEVELLVDTGATLLVLPRPLAERLEVTPRRSQPVVIAGGQAQCARAVDVHSGHAILASACASQQSE